MRPEFGRPVPLALMGTRSFLLDVVVVIYVFLTSSAESECVAMLAESLCVVVVASVSTELWNVVAFEDLPSSEAVLPPLETVLVVSSTMSPFMFCLVPIMPVGVISSIDTVVVTRSASLCCPLPNKESFPGGFLSSTVMFLFTKSGYLSPWSDFVFSGAWCVD